MKKIITMIAVFIVITLGLICISGKKIYAREVGGTTTFEGVGRYSIAIAGNNNATKGTGVHVGMNLITSYPSNWNTIKANIPSNILNRINNMSGSYLNIDGTVVKAFITINDVRFNATSSTVRQILLIKPDGTYQVLNESGLLEINITEKGWYYVSILDAETQPHQSWSILSVYEKSSLPMKYVKILKASASVDGSNSVNRVAELDFNMSMKLKSEFELFGVVLGGGQWGWTVNGVTEDTFEAKLSNGTYKQLYQSTYNGKTIFAGRTSTDFFNGTFNTQRSHTQAGGELDIFHEKLGKDYFNNQDILGYRITKNGTDMFSLNLIGIAQEIYYPDISVYTSITDNGNNDYLYEGKDVKVKVNASNIAISGENNIAYNSTITSSVDECLSNIRNITVKVNGSTSSMKASYDSTKKAVILSDISTITPGQTITIEYDATINSNITSKGTLNSTVSIPTRANMKSYVIDISSMSSTDKEKYKNIYIEDNDNDSISGKNNTPRGTVEVKYIDQVTKKEISTSTTKTGIAGDTYTTSSKTINGYELVVTPSNSTGKYATNTITVTYEYRKLSNVTAKYIDLNSNEEISDKVITTLKEGEDYTTQEKEIEGYELVKIPENKSGVVGSSDIEVIYVYDLIKGKITVTKVDKNNNSKYLSGAIFKIEKVDNDINIDTSFASIEKTTDENGKIEFTELTVGKYRITEIKAPEGYELSNDTIEVEINNKNKEINITASDRLKLELPQTGGKGAVLFIVIGLAFISAGVIIKKLQKKKI